MSIGAIFKRALQYWMLILFVYAQCYFLNFWCLKLLNYFFIHACIFSAFLMLKEGCFYICKNIDKQSVIKFNLLSVPRFHYTVLLLVLWSTNLNKGCGRRGKPIACFLKTEKNIAIAYFWLTYLYNWCIPDLFVSGESYISAALCKH